MERKRDRTGQKHKGRRVGCGTNQLPISYLRFSARKSLDNDDKRGKGGGRGRGRDEKERGVGCCSCAESRT